MRETFAARMRVVGQRYTSKATHLVLEDQESGKRYTIFPQELFKLLDGVEFGGLWRQTQKGRTSAIVFEGEAE